MSKTSIKLKQTITRAIDSSDRLAALDRLCGYYQNGTQQTVKIIQDDATQTVILSVHGKDIVTGSSLEAALEALIKKQEEEDAHIY
jgi:hypothetical protein